MVVPFRLPICLNDIYYLHFFQELLPGVLHDLSLNLHRNMLFMHNVAPPHFACATREYLNEQFAGRWIGKGQEAPNQ